MSAERRHNLFSQALYTRNIRIDDLFKFCFVHLFIRRYCRECVCECEDGGVFQIEMARCRCILEPPPRPGPPLL